MSKVCELCGKSTIAGKRIQHHHSIQWRFRASPKSRQFKPNLRKIPIEVGGKLQKVTTCMKCYKRLRKDQPEVAANQAQVSEATK